MAEVIHHAVYVLNARRKRCVIATTPNPDRGIAAASNAAKRRGAFIVPGLPTEFPATLTPEEVLRHTGRAVPGVKPIATD